MNRAEMYLYKADAALNEIGNYLKIRPCNPLFAGIGIADGMSNRIGGSGSTLPE